MSQIFRSCAVEGRGRVVRGAVVESAVRFGVLAGVTVVSISSVSPVELLVAAVAAAGGAFAARRLRLAAGVAPGGAQGAVRAAVLVPAGVVRGCGVLTSALVSGSRRAGFGRILLREGVGAGWAGVLLAASPDTCVVEIPEPGEVLVHELGPGPGPVDGVVADAEGAP
ncbi:hypothetical protein [Kitasatospora cystarginea]|uniref:hypothetical protein n=1 Tax=Kitasatospora cystarginea TaxID=58350 RepID=UPI0031DA6D4C